MLLYIHYFIVWLSDISRWFNSYILFVESEIPLQTGYQTLKTPLLGIGSSIPRCAPMFCTGSTGSIPVEGSLLREVCDAVDNLVMIRLWPWQPRGYGMSQIIRYYKAYILL